MDSYVPATFIETDTALWNIWGERERAPHSRVCCECISLLKPESHIDYAKGYTVLWRITALLLMVCANSELQHLVRSWKAFVNYVSPSHHSSMYIPSTREESSERLVAFLLPGGQGSPIFSRLCLRTLPPPLHFALCKNDIAKMVEVTSHQSFCEIPTTQR